MEELKVFENAEFGSVRTTTVNGEIMFVGKDVAEILGYINPRDALAKRVVYGTEYYRAIQIQHERQPLDYDRYEAVPQRQEFNVFCVH